MFQKDDIIQKQVANCLFPIRVSSKVTSATLIMSQIIAKRCQRRWHWAEDGHYNKINEEKKRTENNVNQIKLKFTKYLKWNKLNLITIPKLH